MSPQERHCVAGAEPGDYRRLLAALASRARRLGSHDPESAAQEALKRSLEDARSRPAVEFYLSDGAADVHQPSPWPLDQLLAWLHAVLRNIIREERGRAGFKREMPDDGDGFPASGPDVRAHISAVKEYYAMFFLLQTGTLGVFIAQFLHRRESAKPAWKNGVVVKLAAARGCP